MDARSLDARPRGARPDHRRPPGRRTAPAVLLALAVAQAPSLLATPGAAADPIVPPGADAAVRALAEANGRAADATERAMGAAEQLPVRQEEATRTRATADAARGAADTARTAREQAFVAVDALTRSSYQGGDLDQLGALLASPSPGSYLDKVSLLDTISTENRAVLQRYLDASAAADGAQRDADVRATDARRASDDATRTAAEATAAKAEADRDVATAEAALAAATPATRTALRGQGVTNYPTDVPGSGIAVEALRAALTQQGKPYVWGATGPGTFDCSGLVLWAYRQVGVGMPRVSAAQAQVGTPVNPSALQPGDLIFFNSPVSHVGIFVGGGRFLEAPQSGDVVKVSPLRSGVTAVRRISL